jgi:hypothetical protein
MDIVMGILLNQSLKIFLSGILGKTDIDPVGGDILSAVLNSLLIVGKGVYCGGQILSKALDLSVIGFVVGTTVSVALNFSSTLSVGYLTWALLRRE